MPGSIGDVSRLTKRKRVSSDNKSSKRARSESSDEDAQAQITLLADEIFESKKNYNNIVKLINILRPDDEDYNESVAAAVSLCRVFMKFMISGELEKRNGITEKDLVVIKWLRERYTDYKTALLDLLAEDGIGNTALELCMRLLKTEGEHVRNGQDYSFPTGFLTEIVQVLLKPGTDENARIEFSEKYVVENDDIRFYTFEVIESVFKIHTVGPGANSATGKS
jgi:U3 small nucleolar RNA-associated protein 19